MTWREIAAQILRDAYARRDGDVTRGLLRLAQAGRGPMMGAMWMWVDALCETTGIETPDHVSVLPPTDPGGHVIKTLTPQEQFAVDVLAARATLDHEQARALVIPVVDREDFIAYVFEVLVLVTANLPKGLAWT